MAVMLFDDITNIIQAETDQLSPRLSLSLLDWGKEFENRLLGPTNPPSSMGRVDPGQRRGLAFMSPFFPPMFY